MNHDLLRQMAERHLRDIEARNARKPGDMSVRDREDHRVHTTIVRLCEENAELRAKLEAVEAA